MTSPPDADVVVVGGGAMGSAAAWQLASRGVAVVLIEQHEPGHTHGASHGSSRIFRLGYPDALHIELAKQARDLWLDLEDETGTGLLTVTGGVAHGDPVSIGRVHSALVAAGAPSEWLDAAEATRRWPGIRFDGPALYQPGGGRLHADRAVTALQRAASSAGAVVRHRSRVAAIEPQGEDRVRVHTPDAVIRARCVIVTAGAWTTHLLGGVVPLPPLRVTQEQPAHFTALGNVEDWPSFTHAIPPDSPDHATFHGGVYGLGAPGEGVKAGFHGVGPEVDPDHRDYRPRPELAAALAAYVATWLPGLDPSSADPISCTYTTTPDEVFVLDRVGPVVVGAGFSGHGFKFVPVIGSILADLATTGARPEPVFSLSRFATLRGTP